MLLYVDPSSPNVVNGLRWDGSRAGAVNHVATNGKPVVASPDGTFFQIGSALYSRSGQPAGTVESGKATRASFTWADDGRTYCGITTGGVLPAGPAGVPTTLTSGRAGDPAAPKAVAQVGVVHEQTSVRVAGCSVQGDRALVLQSGGQGVAVLTAWSVRLSDGQVLWTKSYAASSSPPFDLVMSPDGRYVAEVRPAAQAGTAGSTTILDAGGNAIGTVNTTVRAWSADDALVATSDPGAGARLVRWRDGSTVWQAPAGSLLWARGDPHGGPSMAVAVFEPASGGRGPTPADVYLVGPDGRGRAVLHQVVIS